MKTPTYPWHKTPNPQPSVFKRNPFHRSTFYILLDLDLEAKQHGNQPFPTPYILPVFQPNFLQGATAWKTPVQCVPAWTMVMLKSDPGMMDAHLPAADGKK